MKKFKSFYLVLIISALLSHSIISLAETVSTPEMATPAYSVPAVQTQSTNPSVSSAPMQPYAQAGINNYLPIVTPELSPGIVTPKTMDNAQLLQPLFLMGSDDRSKQWLVQNADQLHQWHAIGLLVQANTAEDIQTIQALGKGLMIIPTPAKALIQQYGLTHYPVLITKEGITQ